MTINIQIIKSNADDALRQCIRKQILKLETYHTNIIVADVILKKDSVDKEKGFYAEVRLLIKGNDLFGKSKGESFEKAIADVSESLRKRLRKKKTEKKLTRRKEKLVFHGA